MPKHVSPLGAIRSHDGCTYRHFCGTESAHTMRCPGRKEVCYCIAKCQKAHWTSHIFSCRINRPIDSAYRLVRARLCTRLFRPIGDVHEWFLQYRLLPDIMVGTLKDNNSVSNLKQHIGILACPYFGAPGPAVGVHAFKVHKRVCSRLSGNLYALHGDD